MTAEALRTKYLSFFESKGHTRISGGSLLPENDPTVLFTTAGMHPLVPYLLGEEHPAGRRLTSCQKCIRTGDIDSVGDPSHLTFFEMLGNWSLGDYFKREAIEWSYEFLTGPEYLGFDPDRLSVTVFAGNEQLPPDEESGEIWASLGIPGDRIHALPMADNWWGPAGRTGPCGPDTEMFIDTGRARCGPECRPGCSCGKYFEIWNDVFMQYRKTEDGRYELLQRHNVDTGMGVERTIAMLQGVDSVYETELFRPLMRRIDSLARPPEDDAPETRLHSARVVADHLRSAVFILGDERGVTPGNLGQGYVLRRLIRRSVRFARKLGLEPGYTAPLAECLIESYRGEFPDLETHRARILSELDGEEKRFEDTLDKGEAELAKVIEAMRRHGQKTVSGRVAFRLYDTCGFPLEFTEEICRENGLDVDRDGFDKAFEKHKAVSRQSEKSFKGGLADASEATTRLHTATHLLHQALRNVLGDHVRQKGSNITPQRLRFDFSHPEKMTPEQIRAVEAQVNEQIARDLPVEMRTMTLEEAREAKATALFESRYGEKVKVYSVGDFSREVCGGPHVARTGELGRFRIVKESSSSAGVRRIRAVLEPAGEA